MKGVTDEDSNEKEVVEMEAAEKEIEIDLVTTEDAADSAVKVSETDEDPAMEEGTDEDSNEKEVVEMKALEKETEIDEVTNEDTGHDEIVVEVGVRRSRKSATPLKKTNLISSPRKPRMGRAEPILDSPRRVTRAASGTPVGKDRNDELITPRKTESTPRSGRKMTRQSDSTPSPQRSARKSAIKAMADLTSRRSSRSSSTTDTTKEETEPQTVDVTPSKTRRASKSSPTPTKISAKKAALITPRRSSRASSSPSPVKSSVTKTLKPESTPLRLSRSSRASPVTTPAKSAAKSSTPVLKTPIKSPLEESTPLTSATRRTRRSSAVSTDSADVSTPTRRSRRRSGLEPEAVSLAPDGGLVLGSIRKGGSTPRSGRRHTAVRKEDVDVALGLTPTALAPVPEDAQEEVQEEPDQEPTPKGI